MENIQDCFIKRNEDNAVWTKIDEGIMIIATEDAQEKVLKLNKTGASIWEMADGALSVRALVERLAQQFEVDIDTAHTDAVTFIEDMKSRNLILVSSAAV